MFHVSMYFIGLQALFVDELCFWYSRLALISMLRQLRTLVADVKIRRL